jgi:TPR repeat protein
MKTILFPIFILISQNIIANNNDYEILCEENNSSACYNLGVSHKYGYGVLKSLQKAAAYYFKACSLKHGKACSSYESMFEPGLGNREKRDMTKALKYHELGCKYGSIKACTATAWFYKLGEGTTKNLEKSFTLYQKACKENDAIACGGFAGLFKKGSPEWILLLKRSCDLGHQYACDIVLGEKMPTTLKQLKSKYNLDF